MRFSLFFLLIVSMFFSCEKEGKTFQNNFDCEDQLACQEYERRLKLIHDYNFLMKDMKIDSMVKIGSFFEKITGLKTTADIQIDGLMPPTIEDYQYWSIWYSQNYNCLIYNESEKDLSVKDNCNRVLEF